jgi:hypothetical protein
MKDKEKRRVPEFFSLSFIIHRFIFIVISIFILSPYCALPSEPVVFICLLSCIT